MRAHLHIVCPNCNTTNRVPRERLDAGARFGIRSIPTLIAFRNGREVARQSGAMDLPGLLGWIRANV
jgi:thioredoxin-like negative regulator of GroEL